MSTKTRLKVIFLRCFVKGRKKSITFQLNLSRNTFALQYLYAHLSVQG